MSLTRSQGAAATFERAVIEHSMNGIVGCDEQSRIILMNPTARRWCGTDLTGARVEDWLARGQVLREDGIAPVELADHPLRRALDGHDVRDFHMVIGAEGHSARRVSCGAGPIRDEQRQVSGAFMIMVDISAVHELSCELEHLALHDSLTGLPNRRAFETEVLRAAQFAQRGVTSTVIFADLDRFKTCNDRYGHEFGDRVLVQIGHELRSAVRDVDTVARIGGDEFGIVLWDQHDDAAERIFDRLRGAVVQVGKDKGLDLDLSLGAASITADRDVDEVLAEADGRMYEMKRGAAGVHSARRPNVPASGSNRPTWHVQQSPREPRLLARLKLQMLSLVQSEGVESMARALLDEVCAATESPIGFFHLVDDDQTSLTLQAWSTATEKEFCKATGQGSHYAIADAGVWVDCVHAREPVVHNDYLALPHRRGLPDGHAPVVRELVVPILRDDKVVAILGVGNKESDYDGADIDVASTLADLAWDIAERHFAQEQLKASEKRLRSIIESAPFGTHLYELTDDDRLVFIGYNKRADAMLGFDHASLLGKTLEEAFPGNVGTPTPDAYRRVARDQVIWETEEIAYDDGGIAGVFEVLAFPFGSHTMAVFFRDVTEQRKLEAAIEQSDARYRGLISSMDEGFCFCRLLQDSDGTRRDWLFIDANDRLSTLMHVSDFIGLSARQVWPDIELALPEFYDACLRAGEAGSSVTLDVEWTPGCWLHCSITGAAEEHFYVLFYDISEQVEARLRAESANDLLESSLRNAFEMLGKVVDLRDPYTQGHQRGVARLARLLANEMGFAQSEAEAIEIAAWVHDVGKLAIPSEILVRPGQLSPLEFDMVKRHSEFGYDILKDIDHDWPVAEMVLQHHERMDGSGYPSGLRGDAITHGARILMVADVVDAMASHRPYRSALGVDAAMAEILSHPEQYDSEVVGALVRLHDGGHLELEG